MTQRWDAQRARQWYQQMPWLVGCNYAPRTAINQLEMWQNDTFDLATIDQELGWAESLGMNSVRIFLHDLLWRSNARALLDNIGRFLDVADHHGIGAMVVFFDSCWHPDPLAGPQPNPTPGVHNSGWVQSPGVPILRQPRRFDEFEDYVCGVVSHFRADRRVHLWDIWNEPCNPNTSSYRARDLGAAKADIVAPLMQRAFGWARSVDPIQPLTAGLWIGDWSSDQTLRRIDRLQIELSDVISFHNYASPTELQQRIAHLQRFDRPLICSEYMSRLTGNTFEACLPLFKQHRVGAYNWGLVMGKSQTHFPWETWQTPSTTAEPPLWHHEIFRPDGKPYSQTEVQTIRKLTGKA